MLVSTLHLIFNAANRESHFVLDALELVVNTVLSTGIFGEPTINPYGHFSLNRDINTIMKRFGFFVPTTEYIVCPSCSTLYPADEEGKFQDACSADLLEKGICGTKLGRLVKLKGGNFITVPRKRFEYQSIKTWLGRLMSRPGMEEVMEETVAGMGEKAVARDVWDASFLSSFKWADDLTTKEALTHPESGGSTHRREIRIMVSLGIDWFQAIKTGPGGKISSVGAIFLVCLNLPFWLRLRPENVCLAGMIPGPTKPHGDEVDRYFVPVVNDLMDLWTSGVWFTKTHLCDYGRLSRLALAFNCCDLDAARIVNGFAGTGSEAFCSFCKLPRAEMHNLDYKSWLRRTPEEHREIAEKWLRQTTLGDRLLLLAKLGYRWTEFLRLPYYNTIMATVLDVMHAIFKNYMGTHLDFWGVDPEVEGGDGSARTLGRVPSPADMVGGRLVLRCGTITQVSKLQKHVLQALCLETECIDYRDVTGKLTKDQLTAHLQKWVCWCSTLTRSSK